MNRSLIATSLLSTSIGFGGAYCWHLTREEHRSSLTQGLLSYTGGDSAGRFVTDSTRADFEDIFFIESLRHSGTSAIASCTLFIMARRAPLPIARSLFRASSLLLGSYAVGTAGEAFHAKREKGRLRSGAKSTKLVSAGKMTEEEWYRRETEARFQALPYVMEEVWRV